MGDHDWNDGLSAVGTLLKGESFWVAEFLYMILGAFSPIARLRDDESFATRCDTVRQSVKDAMNRYGWDGEWYLQATTDDGLLLGSKVENPPFLLRKTFCPNAKLALKFFQQVTRVHDCISGALDLAVAITLRHPKYKLQIRDWNREQAGVNLSARPIF